MGVSENIIEASWLALVDSITYKLKKEYGLQKKEGSAENAGADEPGADPKETVGSKHS